MDDFFDYNQIKITMEDQHKTAFIYHWGTFFDHKFPFGLKNFDTTF